MRVPRSAAVPRFELREIGRHALLEQADEPCVEGQGVVLVEALASGTPCVGSDVGGIPGVISGVGLLVPPASPTVLAEGILRFLKDPDLWQRSSTEGRKRAEEKYDWDVLVRQIVRVYAEVLGNLPPNGVVRVGER